MIGIAGVKPKLVANLHVTYVLPTVLALNTMVLYGLDRASMIPDWVRTVAGMFLSF